jgi:putative Mn2+ efflux pump MntP
MVERLGVNKPILLVALIHFKAKYWGTLILICAGIYNIYSGFKKHQKND